MERITSRKNPLIAEISKLKDKKYRDEAELFFFEGRKLFTEALAHGIVPVYLFVTEDFDLSPYVIPTKTRVFSVSDEVLAKLSTEKSPQGVICVAKHLDNLHNKYIIDGSVFADESVFLLSQMQDPGNLGTIIRTANALGCRHLVVSEDSADLYHPRTVRASMGALFGMHILRAANMPSAIADLRGQGYAVYAAALHTEAVSLSELTITPKTAFLVGNEGQGLSHEEQAVCSGRVIIPMAEGAESLNVAAASAILLWESAKQR